MPPKNKHTDATLYPYFLVVGIEAYQDNNIGQLFYCVEDAQGLYKSLKSDIGKEKEHVLLDQEATRSNILASLNQHLNNAGMGDLIIVFVSTHGEIAYNDYFFVPHDGKLDNMLGTCISANLLINALSEKVDEGVKVLLILDTCHAGAMGFDIGKYQGKNGGGLSCLFSASAKDLSFEMIRLGHGLFSYHLIKGLQNPEIAQEDGSITLTRLYNYVYNNVMEDSKMKQAPLLIGTLPGDTVLKKL